MLHIFQILGTQYGDFPKHETKVARFLWLLRTHLMLRENHLPIKARRAITRPPRTVASRSIQSKLPSCHLSMNSLMNPMKITGQKHQKPIFSTMQKKAAKIRPQMKWYSRSLRILFRRDIIQFQIFFIEPFGFEEFDCFR